VAPGAYLWWYVDAVSDDGRHALTIIAFVGSVFSPYYRRAFARNPATRAEDHCALNVCLYSPGAQRWTMTERGQRHVAREPHRFQIGPSQLQWNGQSLTIDIQERGAPLPRAVRGRVVLHPAGLCTFSTALEAAGRHRWGPIAPCARIEVDLQEPGLRWQGQAYVDSNEGDEPVENGFQRWDWLRAAQADGRCAVLYDVQPQHEPAHLIGARFSPSGAVEPFTLPHRQVLPATRWWRMPRQVPTDGPVDVPVDVPAHGPAAAVERTLEDTPFYSRSLLRMQLGGQPTQAVHESLDVARLTSLIVQRMLPFRMPRVV
jgi:carotenoid 1,2-hydratase